MKSQSGVSFACFDFDDHGWSSSHFVSDVDNHSSDSDVTAMSLDWEIRRRSPARFLSPISRSHLHGPTVNCDTIRRQL